MKLVFIRHYLDDETENNHHIIFEYESVEHAEYDLLCTQERNAKYDEEYRMLMNQHTIDVMEFCKIKHKEPALFPSRPNRQHITFCGIPVYPKQSNNYYGYVDYTIMTLDQWIEQNTYKTQILELTND